MFEEFVRTENINRLTSLLEREMDSGKRNLLHSLLIEEEDRIAGICNRLDRLDEFISRSEVLISQQKFRLSEIVSHGQDASSAQKLLGHLQKTNDIFRERRQVMAEILGDHF